MTKVIENWLDGDKSILNGSDSGHQQEIQEQLCGLIRRSDQKELTSIGDKLLKLRSNFIVCMLVRHNDIEPKYKTAAFRSLAKRRKTDIPEYLKKYFRENSLVMTYDVLSKLGPVKMGRVLEIFYQYKHIEWKMKDVELDKLLFPISMKQPEFVKNVKRRVKRMLHKITKEEMRDLLIEYRFKELKNNDDLIRKIAVGEYHYREIDRLERECYDKDLLKF